MSRYEPRYGRNYMKPYIISGGYVDSPVETDFVDTITANGDYGPTNGHYKSVTIHVDVPSSGDTITIDKVGVVGAAGYSISSFTHGTGVDITCN